MSNEFSSKQIIRGTLVTSSLTFISRILGFFRDLIVAIVYGASAYADAYFVAFRIPNLLRSFVAEGALSAAFVPIFAQELHHSKEAAQRALQAVTTFLLATTIAISLIGFVFAADAITLIAPGFIGEQRHTAVTLLKIMLPYIVCISLVAMINGALTTLKTFGTSAAAQALMNLVLIIGGLLSALFDQHQGVIVLSISVIIGGLAQVLYQIPTLKRHGFRLQISFRNSATIISQLVKLMAPAVIGATVYQLMIFTATLLSSLLTPGSISWLFYADRIVQLPLGIFSIALSSVLLPALAANMAQADHKTFSTNLGNALRYNSFVLIPIAALIYLSAEDLITVLFQRGAFNRDSVIMTAGAAQALSLGIWASSCQSLLARSFMARRDTVTPTIFGIITLLLNVFLSLILMGVITSDDNSSLVAILISMQQSIAGIIPLQSQGHIGLALASSCSSVISLALFAIMFCYRGYDFSWISFVRASTKALIATLLSYYATSLVVSSFEFSIGLLLLEIGCFTLGYLTLSLLFKSRESLEVIAIIKARLLKTT